MEDYSTQWRHYRRLTWLGVAAFAVFLGALPLSIFVEHLGFSEGARNATFFSLAATGLLSLSVLVLLISFWRCPRCHSWYSRRSIFWISPGRTCVHCGLPLYANSRDVG